MKKNGIEYIKHLQQALVHLRAFGNHALAPWWYERTTPEELEAELSKHMMRPVKVRVSVHEIPVSDYGIAPKELVETYWIATAQ